jgi:hypothetical protein
LSLYGIARLISVIRWWWYEAKTLDTQNATNGGEMGTGSNTGAFFIGGVR